MQLNKNAAKCILTVTYRRASSLSRTLKKAPEVKYLDSKFYFIISIESSRKLICSFQGKQHGHGCKLKYRQNRLRNSLYSRQELIRIRRNLVDCKETQDSQLDQDDRKVFVILPTCRQPIEKFLSLLDHIAHSLPLALKLIFMSTVIDADENCGTHTCR